MKSFLMLNYDNQGFIKILKDEWNSTHFGKKMGNVELNIKEALSFEDILFVINDAVLKAKKEGFEHLTFKISTDKKKIIRSLNELQFYLVDTLITFNFDFKKSKLASVKNNCVFHEMNYTDLDILKDISKKAFKIDRFHSDPSFDDELCNQYYEKWIENSYNGIADKIIVAYVNNSPVGYTTIKLPEDKTSVSTLVLSAVSLDYRNQGIYTSIIHECISWIDGKSDYVRIGTQIDNIAVQKAWIKLGLTIYESQYVFQKDIT